MTIFPRACPWAQYRIASGLAERVGPVDDRRDTAGFHDYHHVANKDHILDGTSDVVFGEIELPSGGAEWRRAMRRRAISAREVLWRHPWPIGLMDSRAGLPDRDGRPRVLGHGQLHLRVHAAGDEPAVRHTSEELAEVAENIFRRMPADEYPYFTELAVGHAMKPGYDYGDEFDFGLDLILDGLKRARAKPTQRRRKAVAYPATRRSRERL